MSKWVNNEEMPSVQRFAMSVTSSTHPNLANWLWNLPYGTAATKLKDVLEAHAARQIRKAQKQADNLKQVSTDGVRTAKVKDGKKSGRKVAPPKKAAAVSPQSIL